MPLPIDNWPPTFFLTGTDHPLRREIGTALAACGWKAVSAVADASVTIVPVDQPVMAAPTDDRIAEVRGLSIHRQGDRFRLGFRDWTACLDPVAGRMSVAGPAIRDEDERILFQDVYVRETILLWLRRRDTFELHAGACGRGDEGILLVGESGSGKTSATLALIESGWSYVSDDAVVVRGTTDLFVHPLRRTFSLKSDLLARRPDLAPAVGGDVLGTGKRRLSPHLVWPDRQMDTLKPTRLIFCEISADETSRFRPINQGEAFRRLLSGSPWVVLDRETASRHLDMYRRLSVQCTGQVFSAGRDVLREPSHLAILLDANRPR